MGHRSASGGEGALLWALVVAAATAATLRMSVVDEARGARVPRDGRDRRGR